MRVSWRDVFDGLLVFWASFWGTVFVLSFGLHLSLWVSAFSPR